MHQQFHMGFKSNSALSRDSFRSSSVALMPINRGWNEDHVEKIGDDEREAKKGWTLSNQGKPKVLVKLGL